MSGGLVTAAFVRKGIHVPRALAGPLKRSTRRASEALEGEAEAWIEEHGLLLPRAEEIALRALLALTVLQDEGDDGARCLALLIPAALVATAALGEQFRAAGISVPDGLVAEACVASAKGLLAAAAELGAEVPLPRCLTKAQS